MDFYERIKHLTKENNLSLISFLESIGINYSSYKSTKKAENLPRADEAVKIAKGLNATVEYLVTGEFEEESISDLEAVLLVKFRKLSDNRKKIILNIVSEFSNN